MQWEKLKPPEPDDPLCCCERDVYQCRCCCRCEDLDEAFTRWLNERPAPGGSRSAVLEAMIGHLEISMIPVLLLLPLLLQVASLHYLLGIAVLTALPGLVLWYYYATHRRKRRTLFFLTLSLYSLFYMYYLFITKILPRGDVSHLQVCTVTSGMLLTIVLLIVTKRGPGFVTSPHLTGAGGASRASADGDGSFPSAAASAPSPGGKSASRTCALCKVKQPPRAGHCRTCGRCVHRLDHHCIWINSCVGQANHRSFVSTLAVFVLTSGYGLRLVLRSLCPRQHLLTALFHCPAVYSQPSTALCFTCAWFSSIVTAALLYLLLVQLVNISFNMTERESLLALRNQTGQSRLCGLVLGPGEHSRGFYKNWLEFLTMAEALAPPQPGLADVV